MRIRPDADPAELEGIQQIILNNSIKNQEFAVPIEMEFVFPGKLLFTKLPMKISPSWDIITKLEECSALEGVSVKY